MTSVYLKEPPRFQKNKKEDFPHLLLSLLSEENVIFFPLIFVQGNCKENEKRANIGSAAGELGAKVN